MILTTKPNTNLVLRGINLIGVGIILSGGLLFAIFLTG